MKKFIVPARRERIQAMRWRSRRAFGICLAVTLGAAGAVTLNLITWPILLAVLVVSMWAMRRQVLSDRARIRREEFRTPRLAQAWLLIEDRLQRLTEAFAKLDAEVLGDMRGTLDTAQQTANHLYQSLVRADQVQLAIGQSEGSLVHAHSTSIVLPSVTDPGAKELLIQADRNLAEYHQRMNALQARVERCHAQALVFVTAMDNVRVRILGYSLGARVPEVERNAFLSSVKELRGQLDAVDKALAELHMDRALATLELDSEGQP